MTKEQEDLAEYLISVIKEKHGTLSPDHKAYFLRRKLETRKHIYVVETALEELGFIERYGVNNLYLRLTEKGWEFPGFEQARQEKIQESVRKRKIEDLTIKELNGSIFQLKYWWLILILNAIASYIITKLVK